MKNINYFIAALICLMSCGGGDDCEIRDIEISIGDCSCADSYALTIDFIHQDAPGTYFSVSARNNQLVGNYKLADLPITINKFELSGKAEDYIKICLDEDGDCCQEFEFIPPNCEPEVGECSISELEVEVLECLDNKKYSLKLNFEHTNAGNDYFDLYTRNNEFFGNYRLDDLPILIDNFVPSGFGDDFIKVCINDREDCCKEIEFFPPKCDEDCTIKNLNVAIGDCISSDTYKLNLDFEYSNPSHPNIEIFVRNGVRIGNYPLSSLPISIDDFKLSGKDYDYIKVCMNDDPDCCEVLEFMPPDCSEKCSINEINYELGPCTSDSTYTLQINLNVNNPSDDSFDVFVRNNEFISYHKLSELPLTIENFEKSGKDYDFIKICINDDPNCCKEIEFMPPDC